VKSGQPAPGTDTGSDGPVAPGPGPGWLRPIGIVLGAGYLVALWLEAAGSGLPGRILPRPLHFFTQVADLFPRATTHAVQWRAEGWRCDLGRFEELDTRAFFAIHRDDKENRFHRAMFFHARQRPVLEALDEFLVAKYNQLHPEARIGAVSFLSLRLPLPPLGQMPIRSQRRPLSEYGAEVEQTRWYATSAELGNRRCQGEP
jgi:hypothetical protein